MGEEEEEGWGNEREGEIKTEEQGVPELRPMHDRERGIEIQLVGPRQRYLGQCERRSGSFSLCEMEIEHDRREIRVMKWASS